MKKEAESDSERISLKKIIVHKVDHRSDEEARLSDVETPLTSGVESFLISHIKGSKFHPKGRYATFSHSDEGQRISGLCQTALSDPHQFVSASKQIAQHLFAVVSKNRNISPSDLICCIYSVGQRNELGLLKMDPEDGFSGRREMTDQGYRVILEKLDNILPTKGLQKCAFIFPESERIADHDLLVIDHQVSGLGTLRPVASFFTNKFLNCGLKLNPTDQTKKFYLLSRSWLKSRDWEQPKKVRFDERIRTELNGLEVSVAAVAAAVIDSELERTDYLKTLREAGLPESFRPEKKIARKMVKYRRFKGDNGLEIVIESTAIGAGKTLEINNASSVEKTQLKIITQKWEEVTK